MLMLQIQQKVAPLMPMRVSQTREIRMEVVFGTPSQNCIGSGVCMVMNRLPRHRTLHCPHAPAWISYDQGKVLFRFDKSEVTREDAIIRFNEVWFPVQEAFEIPRLTARDLGLASTWILPGIYSIEETVKDWILAFLPCR